MYEVITGQAAIKGLMNLRRMTVSTENTFGEFNFQYSRTVHGKWALLRKRFRLHPLLVQWRSKPVCGGVVFESRGLAMSPYHSIGCLVGLPDLPQEAIFELISAMTKLPLSPLPLFGPLNGHVNLGVSMPEGPTRLGQVGFLTSAYDHFTERFFRQPLWREARQYFAVRTELSPELITRINKDLQTRPEGVSARPMRRHAFYRDMKLFWRLCSKIMADHPLYYSLSFAEEWPMLKNLIGLVPPHFFQFLIKDGEEIGFCLATPDYNEVLKSESSDWSNLWRLITTRRTRRARIIYSGILPEFRGQKLIKYVRHQTLLAMYERGVREVESSYIDSKNINSLKNAESTGARASHGFKVYVLAGNDQGAHFGHH